VLAANEQAGAKTGHGQQHGEEQGDGFHERQGL
jgi:hypothetical protein